MRFPSPHRPISNLLALAVLLSAIALSGCVVVVISGPSEVSPGDVVTYELDLTSNVGGNGNATLFLVAEVPVGWSLLSSSFVGSVNGSPVSGSPSVVPGDNFCDQFLVPQRPGMQRLHLEAGPFTTHPDDMGTLTLEFHAAQQPAGEFKLGFAFGGDGDSGSTCGLATYRTINRNGYLLSFVEALFDDADVATLAGSRSVGTTPDGQFVVATASDDDALNLFARNADTGVLAFVETLVDGVGGVAGLDDAGSVEISPEGDHVFVIGREDDAIASFEIDEGDLSFSSAVFDGVGGVTGLADTGDLAIFGDYVYAAAGAGVTVFSRHLATGDLSFQQFLDSTSVPTLADSSDLIVSPDGEYLYVGTAQDQIVILARDAGTGLVSFVADGLAGGADSHTPTGFALSPDGLHLYSASATGEGILLFDRDSSSGLLEYRDTYSGLFGSARDLTISPAGDLVVVLGQNWLSVFARDPDGGLRLIDYESQGDPPVEGIPQASGLSLSPGGEHLYVVSTGPGSIVTFVAGPAFLFTDDFESGDTSTWSATVP